MHSSRSVTPRWSSSRTGCRWKGAAPIAATTVSGSGGSLFAVYPDFTGEIEEVRDLGDRTIARMHVHGRGVESDVPIDLSDEAMWHVAGYRHGKVIWWHFFGSEADALEAAGLRE
jgi:hypothetical protein